MGVNTKAMLRKGVKPDQLKAALENFGCQSVCIESTGVDGMYTSRFQYTPDAEETEHRTLYFWPNYKSSEFPVNGFLVDLSTWGSTVPIMKHLCETFGGWMLESDCSGDDPYLINSEEFAKGKEHTREDQMRMQILKYVSMDNLDSAMKIIEDYTDAEALEEAHQGKVDMLKAMSANDDISQENYSFYYQKFCK